MSTVFSERRGVLMVEFMQQRITIASEVCCETQKALKGHGMMTSGVVFFHDNARPHTAARTRALLEFFNWELFDHPP
jgi:hypothetical protein